MSKYEEQKTPVAYRSLLNRLRYKTGDIYRMFDIIRREKTVSRKHLFLELQINSSYVFNNSTRHEFLDVLVCLGAIRLEGEYIDTQKVIYVKEYLNDYIDMLLKDPVMFDMMIHINPSN